MENIWIRAALKDDVSKLDFDQAAWKYGWLWWKEVPRKQDSPYEVIRTTRTNQTSIHYFDDRLIDVRYIIIDGQVAEVQKVHEEVCSSLDIYNYKDVEQLVKNATSSEDYIRAIYLVAIAAPPLFDPRYSLLFEQVLANESVKVRDAAIFAIGYVGWPEFRNILEQIQKTDTDLTVRESAAIMLDGYERFQIDSENPIQPFSGVDKSKETKAHDLQTEESHLGILHKKEYSLQLKEYPKQYIIFKNSDVKQNFIEFANNNGWQMKGSRKAERDEYLPFEIAWLVPDWQTAIHYIEDWHIEDDAIFPFSLKTPYLILEGSNLANANIALSIQSTFDIYSNDEIIKWVNAATDSDDLINAVVHLGYIAPEKFDIRFFDALQKALSHPNTWVRLAAVWASGSTGWSEFQKVLEKISTSDPSGDVRLEASQMLEVFEIESENRLLRVFDESQKATV